MLSKSSLLLFSVLALVWSVSSTPIEERTTSRCTARDLAIVRRTVIDPVFFCKWWQEDTRTRTPFLEFTVSQINTLCACIAPRSSVKSTKQRRAPVDDFSHPAKRSTTNACRKEVSVQFTEPWHFCKFYNAYPRTSSPFRKYTAKGLIKLCNCVEGKANPTTKKSLTITKKTSTSTKKGSTSTKKGPTSTKKISASATRSSTSTTKPLTSTKRTSTSIQKTSAISRKTSTTTAKRSTSTKKASTSTQKISTSIKKTSESTAKPSSSSNSKAMSSSTKGSSASSSKRPSSVSHIISATSHCKPRAPRYPGSYGYLAWNNSNNMGNNNCGAPAPPGNRPPQSYVLAVHQIFPYVGNCVQLCLETDACQSWGLDTSHTECTLYSALTKDYIKPLQTSHGGPQFYYYDASCYDCSDTIEALSCNILADSPPSGSSCGQLGLSVANAQVASYGNWTDIQTLNNCALNCMTDLNCKSFSTDERFNLCFYYSQTASKIANHYRGNTTEQTLYDVRCFVAIDNGGECGYQK
ncbi:hypothetical protein E4T39_08731 [Aureobasidium subglaciale]|nr:hypothetical protein E4T39_08731 [Aureobasidium subglaciale]